MTYTTVIVDNPLQTFVEFEKKSSRWDERSKE